MIRAALAILAKNAGLLSVVSALTLFFSWIVTNTLGSRYSRTKQSVETAESTFRLYSTLHGLRDQMNSLAMEIVQTKHSPDASRFRTGVTGDAEADRISTDFDLTRLAAHQINELMDFTAQASDYSVAVASHSPTADQLDASLKEVETIRAPISRMEQLVERLAPYRMERPDDYRAAVGTYVGYIRKNAIPAVGPLYERVVDLSNQRREEGRNELRAARARATVSGKIALVLYAIGTLMALGGQYLDKIYARRAASPGTDHDSP